MSEVVGAVTEGSVEHATRMLQVATDARKCWACGCLRHALDTIDYALPASGHNEVLDAALASAREHLLPPRYECLGCDICFRAIALNDLAAAGSLDLTEDASCPTDAVEKRQGWPPLPGAYTVLRYQAPVAVCTLNDEELAKTLARAGLPELAIVGTLHTENLGIERLVANIVANPHIRFVIVWALIAVRRLATYRASHLWHSPRAASTNVSASLEPRADGRCYEIWASPLLHISVALEK
jgi:tetrahydromethanopterin S-methyltransferase subunit A